MHMQVIDLNRANGKTPVCQPPTAPRTHWAALLPLSWAALGLLMAHPCATAPWISLWNRMLLQLLPVFLGGASIFQLPQCSQCSKVAVVPVQWPACWSHCCG